MRAAAKRKHIALSRRSPRRACLSADRAAAGRYNMVRSIIANQQILGFPLLRKIMEHNKKIKVLVIDDSVFMRQMISDVLAEDPEIEVAGHASNGKDGIEKAKNLLPDVITLDYQMSGLDGIAVLKRIMREHPVPVVMISAYTKEGGAVALEALREGAVDYVLKPSGEISLDIKTIKSEIIEKVKIAAQANLKALKIEVEKLKIKEESENLKSEILNLKSKVIAIGSSTGGTKGVELILKSLPAGFPVPILIVQHMPEIFTALFANRLNRMAKITVKEGEDGEEVKAGVAYIAPGGWHMIIKSKIKNQKSKIAVIELTKDAPIYGLRPAADALFKSIAKIYGANAIGVILSGIGADGVDGLNAIYKARGRTIAQDKKTSVVFGMPKSAIEAGVVDYVLPIDKIAGKIAELISNKTIKH